MTFIYIGRMHVSMVIDKHKLRGHNLKVFAAEGGNFAKEVAAWTSTGVPAAKAGLRQLARPRWPRCIRRAPNLPRWSL